jgi:hypothetical protein
MEVDAGAPVQDDIGHAEACEFGDPGAGVVQRREHDPIALPAPAISRWCVKDRLDLAFGEEPEQWLVEALHRDREDALDARQSGGIFERGKVHERSNGREARIPTANHVVTVALQMIKEGQDQRRIHVVELEPFGSLAEVLVGKLQQ